MYRHSAIAIAPQPATGIDMAEQTAFAVAARVAERYGLKPYTPHGAERQLAWKECFMGSNGRLCGKWLNGEIQFAIVQAGTRPLPATERLRHELLDSLRAEFGADRVRECEWKGQ